MAVLAADHLEPWSRAELERDAEDIEPAELEVALTHLTEQGVVTLNEGLVSASRPTRQLDALGMIAI